MNAPAGQEHQLVGSAGHAKSVLQELKGKISVERDETNLRGLKAQLHRQLGLLAFFIYSGHYGLPVHKVLCSPLLMASALEGYQLHSTREYAFLRPMELLPWRKADPEQHEPQAEDLGDAILEHQTTTTFDPDPPLRFTILPPSSMECMESEATLSHELYTQLQCGLLPLMFAIPLALGNQLVKARWSVAPLCCFLRNALSSAADTAPGSCGEGDGTVEGSTTSCTTADSQGSSELRAEESSQTRLKPDMVLLSITLESPREGPNLRSMQNKSIVLVGELKYVSRLMQSHDTAVNLLEAYKDVSHTFHGQAQQAVRQVYTYMVTWSLCYGFISCWNATWLVYVPPGNRHRVFISDAILATDSGQNPTMLGSLSWLQLQGLLFACSGRKVVPFRSPTIRPPATRGDQQQGAGGGGDQQGGPGGPDGSSKQPGPEAGGSSGPTSNLSTQPSSRYMLRRRDVVALEPYGMQLGGQLGSDGPKILPGPTVEGATAPLAESAAGPTIVEGTPSPMVEGAAAGPTVESAAVDDWRPDSGTIVQVQFAEEICCGGDANVFNGTVDGVPAVIKVFMWWHKCQAAFQRECTTYQALAPLQGLAVPRVLARGKLPNGLRFIAMEPVEGGKPLSTCPRPVPSSIANAAMHVLAEAHAACPGFLHGDVRLENMMLVPGDSSELAADVDAAAVPAAAADAQLPGSGSASDSSAAPRCLLLDFARSRLDGTKEKQQAEQTRLRELLGLAVGECIE